MALNPGCARLTLSLFICAVVFTDSTILCVHWNHVECSHFLKMWIFAKYIVPLFSYVSFLLFVPCLFDETIDYATNIPYSRQEQRRQRLREMLSFTGAAGTVTTMTSASTASRTDASVDAGAMYTKSHASYIHPEASEDGSGQYEESVDSSEDNSARMLIAGTRTGNHTRILHETGLDNSDVGEMVETTDVDLNNALQEPVTCFGCYLPYPVDIIATEWVISPSLTS